LDLLQKGDFMTTRDAFQIVDQLEEAAIQKIVDRLEFRGRDPVFSRFRDSYFDRLDLRDASTILDVGCGTGVIARAIATQTDASTRVTGLDPSRALLDAGASFAGGEGLADRIDFQVGDGASMAFPDGSFDRVIAHTTISHVAEPQQMLHEMARVLVPGGRLAIFDGDYASWSFGYPDDEFSKSMNEAIVKSFCANPMVLRMMPHLLHQSGLSDFEAMGWVYAEIGPASFFRGGIETYTPWMARAQTATQEEIDCWVTYQRDAIEKNEFFGSGNYYAYVATKP
jgi:SAM-dependent methyltransferase